MSEATKPFNIREFLAARNNLPRVQVVPVPGVGPIRVRRVDTLEAVDFKTGVDAVVATVVDEKDIPLFKDVAVARTTDWGFMRVLISAYDQANQIAVEDAEKN